VRQTAEAANRAGGGLVVTVERGDLTGCLDQVRHLRQAGHYRHPVLLDAARYAGDDRRSAAASFDERWIEGQRELGLPVLTDSGYLAPHDTAGCLGILERAARLGEDAIALLPMHPYWLADPHARGNLVRYVEVVGVPVAVVLERTVAPVDPVETLRGLLRLLGCAVPVIVLSADLSALGALSSGAAAAAVGTGAVWGDPDPGRPERPRPWGAGQPSVLIRQCLSYQPLPRVEAAMRRHPDNGMWHCTCSTCAGRSLAWLIGQPDPARAHLALRHSAEILLDLRTELVGPSVHLSQRSWQARCATAASRLREVGWARQPMLTHWQEAITPPAIPRLTIPAPRRPLSRRRPSSAVPPQAAR
jgi:hypothetical protein